MIPIDYDKIGHAISFYKCGYPYIDVPWVASKPVADLTRPEGASEFPYRDQMLVASGEQSFLQLIADGKLSKGKYMCVTPCFRHEDPISEGSRLFFMKAELINTEDTTKNALDEMITWAVDFFELYVLCKIIPTGENTYDILTRKTGIELGSYGIRQEPLIGSWVYGTACAEPRLSYATQVEN